MKCRHRVGMKLNTEHPFQSLTSMESAGDTLFAPLAAADAENFLKHVLGGIMMARIKSRLGFHIKKARHISCVFTSSNDHTKGHDLFAKGCECVEMIQRATKLCTPGLVKYVPAVLSGFLAN